MTEELYRRILPEEMRRRHFMTLDKPRRIESPEFNLEYMVHLVGRGQYAVERKGDALAGTVEQYEYGVGGVILILPSNDTRVNQNVYVEIYRGKMHGTIPVPADEKPYAGFCFESERIEPFCSKYFPNMVMRGTVIFATERAFPGDMPRAAFFELFKKELENGDFPRVAAAHKAFLDVYTGKARE